MDVLGTAVIAMGDKHECGLAVQLETHYLSPAKVGEPLRVRACVRRRGGRLVSVDVDVRTAADRPVFTGTVTKSLRGLSKAAAARATG